VIRMLASGQRKRESAPMRVGAWSAISPPAAASMIGSTKRVA